MKLGGLKEALVKQAGMFRLARWVRAAAETPIPGTPRLFIPPSRYRSLGELANWERGARSAYNTGVDRLAGRISGRIGGRAGGVAGKLVSAVGKNPGSALLAAPFTFTPVPAPAMFFLLKGVGDRLIGDGAASAARGKLRWLRKAQSLAK